MRHSQMVEIGNAGGPGGNWINQVEATMLTRYSTVSAKMTQNLISTCLADAEQRELSVAVCIADLSGQVSLAARSDDLKEGVSAFRDKRKPDFSKTKK